jgi:hypothetical protein
LENLSCSKLEFSPFLSRAAARSSLHPSPKFCIYSLRSGELSTKVRRAFPATFLVSGENHRCCKVALVVLYAVVYSFSRIRVRLIMFLIYLPLFRRKPPERGSALICPGLRKIRSRAAPLSASSDRKS